MTFLDDGMEAFGGFLEEQWRLGLSTNEQSSSIENRTLDRIGLYRSKMKLPVSSCSRHNSHIHSKP